MNLDFSALGNAINQLEKSLHYATSAAAKTDPGLYEQLRNSVTHCFKFTYELSHKMLKRYLEETTANPEEFDLSTFQNLIRTDNEKALTAKHSPTPSAKNVPDCDHDPPTL